MASNLRVAALAAALGGGLWLAVGTGIAARQEGSPSTRPVASDDDAPATRPAARRGREPRIVQPWSGLADLTAEQEQQIKDIRRDILERMAELRDEERERIMSVLTEEQREEIPKIEKALRDRSRGATTRRASDDETAGE